MTTSCNTVDTVSLPKTFASHSLFVRLTTTGTRNVAGVRLVYAEQAESRRNGAVVRALRQLVKRLRERLRHRQARAAFQHVVQLDDRMLRDIGVTRNDVDWANALPMDCDASTAMHQRARDRRHYR